MTNGDVTVLSGVFSIAFLMVLLSFGFANMKVRLRQKIEIIGNIYHIHESPIVTCMDLAGNVLCLCLCLCCVVLCCVVLCCVVLCRVVLCCVVLCCVVLCCVCCIVLCCDLFILYGSFLECSVCSNSSLLATVCCPVLHGSTENVFYLSL